MLNFCEGEKIYLTQDLASRLVMGKVSLDVMNIPVPNKFIFLGADSQKKLRNRNLQSTENWHIFGKWCAKCMVKAKWIRNDLCCVASFISTLLKNGNHYLTDVKIKRNMGYYYLKWRDKFTVSDIWHKI